MDDNRDHDLSSQAWKVLESKYSYKDEWLVVRSDRVLLPDDTILPAYHTIEAPDWVSGIAITRDGDVLLVEQYRHSIGRPIIELPAGWVDRKDDSVLAAMKRELLEETGYASDSWHAIGAAPANPARQTNTSYAFLALDAERVARPNPEASEFVRTHEMPWHAFRGGITDGSLQMPALHTCCLLWLQAFAASSADPRITKLALWPYAKAGL
jgi:ADP-ribose pyrophosphatase